MQNILTWSTVSICVHESSTERPVMHERKRKLLVLHSLRRSNVCHHTCCFTGTQIRWMFTMPATSQGEWPCRYNRPNLERGFSGTYNRKTYYQAPVGLEPDKCLGGDSKRDKTTKDLMNIFALAHSGKPQPECGKTVSLGLQPSD